MSDEPIKLQLEFTGGGDAFTAWLRQQIRVNGRAVAAIDDRATILRAVEVLRRRRRKRTFTVDVLIRVLEGYADRLDKPSGGAK